MYYSSTYLQKAENKGGDAWIGALRYKDENGKWRAIRKTFHVKYKREAKVLLSQWRDEMEEKKGLSVEYKTVREAVLEYLENQKNLNDLSIVTYRRDVRQAEYSIFPYIGDKSFYDLTASDLQMFINHLSARYKPSTVITLFAILSKTLKHAYRMGQMNDIVRQVSLPKQRGRKINFLDRDGRRRFFSLMTPECKFYVPSMIAYYTGMRAGEVCGLKWNDVDFESGTIYVRRAVKSYRDERGNKVVIVESTKNYKERTVPILPQLRGILEAEMDKRGQEGEDFVVLDREPNLLCTSFLKWSQRNKVYGTLDKPITMHGLRHTFATLGVQSKMDIKSLSSILGHASAAMTLDVYASDDENAKQANMTLLGEMLSEESA